MVTGSIGDAAGDDGVVAVAVVGGDPVVGPGRRGRVAGRGGHAAGERLGVGEQRRAGGGGVVVEVEGDRAGRVVPAADGGLVGDRGADGGAGRLLAGVDRRWPMVTGSTAAPLVTDGVVAVAVVGGDPVVGALSPWRCSRPRWPRRPPAFSVSVNSGVPLPSALL